VSGELNISAGGAISVDPDEMRVVADRMLRVAAVLEDAKRIVEEGYGALCQVPRIVSRVDLGGLPACAGRLSRIAAGLSEDAAGTRLMADVFELADLRAQHEMLSISHPDEAMALQERMDELLASDARVDGMALSLAAGWEDASQEGLLAQWGDGAVGAALPSIGVGSVLAMRLMNDGPYRYGLLAKGTRLHGPPPPVVVKRVAATPVTAAPRSLGDIAARIPKERGQVAVEKRTHRDGRVSYDVYVDGTRSVTPGDEPWDMGSNWDLFMDRRMSASYGALELALEQAGVAPGDTVNLNGYSQGGLAAGPLAMSGLYDTERVTLIGTPTVPSLAPDQTLIHVFHTDDPVGSGLTGGGQTGTTGSSESVTISREAATSGEFSSAGAHFFDSYLDTLALADASEDPRIVALHEQLRVEAADIVSIERTVYEAKRP